MSTVVLEKPQFPIPLEDASAAARSRPSSGAKSYGTFSGNDARLIAGATTPGACAFGLIGLVILLFVLLIGTRWAASLLIDYSWWKELGQVNTWIDLYAYSTLPIAAATVAHMDRPADRPSRGVKFAGGQVSDYPIYSRLSSLVLLALAFFRLRCQHR